MWTPTARTKLARQHLTLRNLPDRRRMEARHAVAASASHDRRPRRWPLRLIFDGVQYVLRTGCAWRHLPRDFPPWGTVHRWFLRLSEVGVFERLAHALTMADRERARREAGPTRCILDAQAAYSGGVGVAGKRGYDPARGVVGRKRHALTDTDGRLLLAAVSPANLHDRHGGITLLHSSRRLWPFLAHCFADQAYRGKRVGAATPVTVEIVQPTEKQKGLRRPAPALSC